ncbi:MAG: plasmid pRiA4b ORF-3 family protein [Clostridia bacterium]|nr:plasmid pRiA4b ORF-3 family protein [Clostridia bacterium]
MRIPANITFNDLAAIIEIAFEWCGYHLYEFKVGETLHEIGQFIEVPTEDEYVIKSIRGKTQNSGKDKINKYLKKYKRMKFVYDFGDDWVHDIIIEKEVNKKIEYPVCVKAKYGAYPEDCGEHGDMKRMKEEQN